MKINEYFFYNDKLEKNGTPVITADNRSFRYGDGCFETIRIADGKIALKDYHFKRLFSSVETLQFYKPEFFNAVFLEKQINVLINKNQHKKSARVRINVFGDDKNFNEDEARLINYIIQSWSIDPSVFEMNNDGLIADIYKDARKVCDAFSHIKSNNYLPYFMAAVWSKKNKLNDAIVLNSYNRICDTTIANIFIVKDGKIKTPSLNEGCINGVMRRYLIECLRKENIPFEESAIETEELLEANEIFITNTIRGIKWIKQCGKSNYTNQLSKFLYERFLKCI